MIDIKISTKNELEARSKELENEFNTVRDSLAEFIQSTQTTIENMTSKMDELSKEYNEINEELEKRDGRKNRNK